MVELSEILDPRLSRARVWLALAVLLCGFASFNLLLVVFADRLTRGGPTALACVMLGGCSVQPLLLGLWAALGPGSLLMRVPVVISVAAAGFFSIGLPALWHEDRHAVAAEIVTLVGSVGTLMIAAAALLGTMLRWWTRQSIERTRPSGDDAGKPIQFSTRYLLGMMTLCAVVMGIGSRFFQNGNAWPYGPAYQLVVQMSLVAAAQLAICLPTAMIPWLILSRLPREPLLGLGAIVWFAWTMLIMAVVAALSREGREIAPYILAIQAGAAAMGAASAMVLHWAGYRLTLKRQANTGTGYVALSELDLH